MFETQADIRGEKGGESDGELNLYHNHKVNVYISQSQCFIQSRCSWSARGGALLLRLSEGRTKHRQPVKPKQPDSNLWQVWHR